MTQTTAPNPSAAAPAGGPSHAIEPSIMEHCREIHAAVQHALAKVIVGQNGVIEQILISILTRIHALLADPSKSLAETFSGSLAFRQRANHQP
ncbi:MAG: hypothetical protein NTW21_33400 [Verrucomicrobia bacterium]|nr:hypothetical protein [Verrucomicrobiota bacterium]